MTLGLVAAALSAIALWLLAGGDPKRLRALRMQEVKPHRRSVRLALFLAVLLPGLGLLLAASAAELLIWFGAVTVCGWLIAEVRAPGRDSR